MFADENHPWMKGIEAMAACTAAHRQPVAADNPFLKAQNEVSEQIIAGLDSYRAARDKMSEQLFFGLYGSPFVQALLGINDNSKVRPSPSTSPDKIAEQHVRTEAYAAKLTTGGFNEALTRAVLYVTASEQMFDQRCALALNVARKQLMHLSLAAFKGMVRDQFFVIQREPERAVEALRSLVPEDEVRETLLKQVQAIVGAGGPVKAAERDRLATLSMVLGEAAEKTVSPAAARRTAIVAA
jgi:hypothetical protein